MKKYSPIQKRAMLLVPMSKEIAEYSFNEPPTTWQYDCNIIQKEGKITLSEQARNELWQTIYLYMGAADHKSKLPTATEVKKRLEKVHSATEKLLSLINHALEEETPQAIWPLLREYSEQPQYIDELPDTLFHLEKSCDNVLKNFDKNTKGGSRREAYHRFNDFINGLAKIYESAGGNVAANYSENCNNGQGGRCGPFVRFCWHSSQSVKLPTKVKRPIESAFGNAVNNALNSTLSK